MNRTAKEIVTHRLKFHYGNKHEAINSLLKSIRMLKRGTQTKRVKERISIYEEAISILRK